MADTQAPGFNSGYASGNDTKKNHWKYAKYVGGFVVFVAVVLILVFALPGDDNDENQGTIDFAKLTREG
jgi:hypothetical protein